MPWRATLRGTFANFRRKFRRIVHRHQWYARFGDARLFARDFAKRFAEKTHQRDDLAAVVVHRMAEAFHRGEEPVFAFGFRALVAHIVDRSHQGTMIDAELQGIVAEPTISPMV